MVLLYFDFCFFLLSSLLVATIKTAVPNNIPANNPNPDFFEIGCIGTISFGLSSENSI